MPNDPTPPPTPETKSPPDSSLAAWSGLELPPNFDSMDLGERESAIMAAGARQRQARQEAGRNAPDDQ